MLSNPKNIKTSIFGWIALTIILPMIILIPRGVDIDEDDLRVMVEVVESVHKETGYRRGKGIQSSYFIAVEEKEYTLRLDKAMYKLLARELEPGDSIRVGVHQYNAIASQYSPKEVSPIRVYNLELSDGQRVSIDDYNESIWRKSMTYALICFSAGMFLLVRFKLKLNRR
ncbi:MAG: hypothetical protein AAFY36_11545 [Bacteroidota bacterium]